MSTRNAISSAVRCALLGSGAKAVTIGCALFVVATSASGQAQQGQAAEPGAPEEVVVTGSRLRRDTFNSVSPVQLITREEVTAAGFSSATEALQSTAVTNGGAQINNAFGGFVTDGGPGANTLSLRGLGAGRTLVLINGRRVAPSGTRGAVGSADLNVLPNAIIDHVEVLRDGASSIYGSDAIAGVINVVTREDTEGVTFEAQYNDPLDGGGEQADLHGRRLVRRALVVRRVARILRPHRDHARGPRLDPVQRRRVARSRHGRVARLRRPADGPAEVLSDHGDRLERRHDQHDRHEHTSPGVGLRRRRARLVTTTFNRWRPNTAVTTGVVGFEGVGGGLNNLNVRDTFEPRMMNESLISPGENSTAFIQATYDLRALGAAELYFDFLGHRRESQQTNYRQLALDYRQGSPLIPSNLAFSAFGPDQGTSGGSAGRRARIPRVRQRPQRASRRLLQAGVRSAR